MPRARRRRVGGDDARVPRRRPVARSSLHSWAILDSHDSPRFRTIAGSRERQLVGIGLQMTTPGVPMVFAGDELGLEGEWGEDARRTMPWDRPETWDTALLGEYRRLIALRRSSAALARGGIRYAFVDDDVIAYLRETRGRAPPLSRQPGRRTRRCACRSRARRSGARDVSTATTPSSKATTPSSPRPALHSTSGG